MDLGVEFQLRNILLTLHGSLAAALPPDGISPFDLLPDDITEMIFSNLGTGDRARLRCVCKRWNTFLRREDIPMPVEFPWLILPESNMETTDKRHEIRFWSPNEDRNYHFWMPFKGRWSFCGSSRGWLIIGGWPEELCGLHTAMLRLWNPLSGRHVTLPPLSTIPYYNPIVFVGYNHGFNSITSYILQIEVFSIGNTECVAMIFCNPTMLDMPDSQLVICRMSGDLCWTAVLHPNSRNPKYVRFHAGELYVMFYRAAAGSQRIVHEETLITPLSSACEVKVNLLTRYPIRTHHDQPQPVMALNYEERADFIDELCESSITGELLLVSAIIDSYSFDIRYPCDWQHMQKLECLQTSRFEVHRMGSMERVKDIGPQAIFIGGWNSPIAISLEGQIGAGNIYFSSVTGQKTMHEPGNGSESWRMSTCGLLEQGVFSLPSNGRLLYATKEVAFESAMFAGWFMPNLF